MYLRGAEGGSTPPYCIMLGKEGPKGKSELYPPTAKTILGELVLDQENIVTQPAIRFNPVLDTILDLCQRFTYWRKCGEDSDIL